MWLDLGEYHGPSHFHAFVMFVVQRTKRRIIEEAYRTYVTDSLQYAPQNKYIGTRFADMIMPHESIDVQATIENVIEKLGLEVGGEHS